MLYGRIWTATNSCSVGCRLHLAQIVEGIVPPVAMHVQQLLAAWALQAWL
jgi:hypothetical protein